MEFGLEFRPIHTLENISGLHSLLEDLTSGSKSGFNYPLTLLSNKDPKLDLQVAHIFGNYNVVDKPRYFYLNLIKKYVVQGECLPLSLFMINRIPGVIFLL